MPQHMTFAPGMVFGRFTVTSILHKTKYCLCDCACGNRNIKTVRQTLRAGRSKSCGCMRNELIGKANTTHGQSNSREYRSWKAMRDRCGNPNFTGYAYYGGRGITICDRWSEFANFLADMGQCPKGHSLDRWPDHDGNYEPSNCRWATPKQQVENRGPFRLRKNKKFTPEKIDEIKRWRLDGESLKSIAKDFNVSFQHISHIDLMGQKKRTREQISAIAKKASDIRWGKTKGESK